LVITLDELIDELSQTGVSDPLVFLMGPAV
jgi:hypothetical protein